MENTGEIRKKLICDIKDKCILITKNTLDSLTDKGRLLDSDPSHGFSEFTLQILIYNNLLNQDNYKENKFKIEIEKPLTSTKRCDLFIKTIYNDILIIELKYIKISYLKLIHNEYKPEMTSNAKYVLYKKNALKIKEMNHNDILELKRFSEFKKSLTDKPLTNDQKYEPIENIFNDGLEQAKGYAKTQYNKEINVYYCVIMGIGFSIIQSELLLYNHQ